MTTNVNFVTATTLKVSTREKIAESYKKMLPVALKLLTDRLNLALPILFGDASKNLDDLFPTAVQKTKFLTHLIPCVMEEASKIVGVSYKYVDGIGYDVEFEVDDDGDISVVVKVEEKASTMDPDGSAATFATGNCYSQVKEHLHFVMRLVNEGNTFTDIFAALVNPAEFKDSISGWKKEGNGNSGFDTFHVSVLDFDCVTKIFGEVLTVGKGNSKVKYCQVRYESLV
jgi:hypothetical protein